MQRGHRPWRAVKIAAVNVQLQRDFTPRTRFEGIAQDVEIAGHQRKQVARFRERILPLDPVAAVFQLALGHAVTVGEQERVFCFIGDDSGGEARQNVRAVQIPGNMAEAFRFALGTQRFAGLIQSFQRGIRRGADFVDDGQGEMFR